MARRACVGICVLRVALEGSGCIEMGKKSRRYPDKQCMNSAAVLVKALRL